MFYSSVCLCSQSCFFLALRPCPPARTGFSGLRPEIGKNWKKIGFGLPHKIGKNIIRNLPQNSVLGSFSSFSANLFLFSGGSKTNIFSYCFPISGRRPENPVLTGGQGLAFLAGIAWFAAGAKTCRASPCAGPEHSYVALAALESHAARINKAPAA